jgi:DNA-binding SARP family transcriptional activator
MRARLRLLGGLRLETEEAAVTGPATQRKRLALLALLGSAAGWLSRERLAAFLWPESDSERARHQLASAIYELRRVLGEDVILTMRDELRLNLEVVSCDVSEFERALGNGQREHAISLYAGPFLDGFFLAETPEFEHWVAAERARLAQEYAQALEELALEKAALNDRLGAVLWWRKLAAHDLLNSRVALGLMRALDAAGDRAGALQHARTHTILLQQELGLEPDPEITALVERLHTTPAEPRAAPRPGAPVGAPQPAPAPVAEFAAPSEKGAGSATRSRKRLRLVPVLGVVLALVTLLYAARQGWLGGPGGATNETNRLPVVVLMDSPHPSRVYDEETRQASGTNADIINDVLRDLPIQRIKETVGPLWHRDEEVRMLAPALIVMHLSSFCEERCDPQRLRLRSFLEYLAETDTRFLIYSRITTDTLAMELRQIMGDLPRRFPELSARVHIFSALDHGTPHWKDPATAAALKLRVRELLELR